MSKGEESGVSVSDDAGALNEDRDASLYISSLIGTGGSNKRGYVEARATVVQISPSSPSVKLSFRHRQTPKKNRLQGFG